MSEEPKSPVTKNSYVPYILPEWTNQCNDDKLNQEILPKIVQLTDENAPHYSGITSHVGWRRRVDHAVKFIENKTNDIDSSKIVCLLENAVSTVIVLASGGTIPDEYLLNTFLFLRKVQNEFGENPPNIAAFLKFLKTKASEKVLLIIESVEDSEKERLPPNLTITPIPRNNQDTK